jgi:hypothetical protein
MTLSQMVCYLSTHTTGTAWNVETWDFNPIISSDPASATIVWFGSLNNIRSTRPEQQ